jgi:DNA-binding CsgD family transcriptional regulator
MKSLIEKLFEAKAGKLPKASRREQEVAGYIAAGNTNQQIGDILGISIKTVEKHRESLHRKFHFRNTADLCRWALAKGLAHNEWL